MKIDDRSLLGFSLAVTGIAVIGMIVAVRPAPLIARAHSGAHASHSAAVRAEQTGMSQTTQSAAQQTAGEKYMNVQVLKDIPADQLLPAMQYITAALGVECQYCHVAKNFASDDKPHKLTARKMMTMMFAIDKDNFNGRQEVTCYTCHQGSSHPHSVPSLAALENTSATNGMAAGHNGGMGMGRAPESETNSSNSPAAPALSVDAILAKYTDALGGTAAIEKITSLDEKGTATMPARGGTQMQIEEVRKAPDKALLTMTLPNGKQLQRAYNGTVAWQAFPGRGAEDLTWDDLARAKQWATFIPAVNMKQNFVREQPIGTEKIGDQTAYRVMAIRKGGRVIFYFDAQSGLLLRVAERIQSPLGSLPQNTDYSDYRDVNGVKFPFTVTVTRVQGPTIYKWDSIQANAPVDDAQFEKPAQKSVQQ